MDYPINIEKVVRSSRSKLIRSLPGVIVRFMIRAIHQHELNETIMKHSDKTGIPFVNSILNEWNIEVIIKGEGNIPANGKFIFVANHPVGAMDSLAFLSMIGRFFPDVVSPSNELFNYIPNLRPLILGINVFGKNTRETAEKMNQLFESGSQIMIFPSGEVSRRVKGKISDPLWQKTFITKAIAHQRDIIPVHISGRNSDLFYSVANLRKSFGIKLYFETFLLPREMMKQKNSPVELTVGKPVPWQTFSSERSQSEWAQIVKEIIYNIPHHI